MSLLIVTATLSLSPQGWDPFDAALNRQKNARNYC
jgi:hypothetical protein